jgi:hypothetical protein
MLTGLAKSLPVFAATSVKKKTSKNHRHFDHGTGTNKIFHCVICHGAVHCTAPLTVQTGSKGPVTSFMLTVECVRTGKPVMASNTVILKHLLPVT